MQTDHGTPHNILYVDDDADNLTAFKAMFRRHYSVFCANGAEEAIEILSKQPVDLIISDQRMPKMTGVEFFEKILDSHPDPVRIILTGYSDVQAIIDAINRGKVWHYTTKPWKMAEMKALLDRGLEYYSLKIRAQRLEVEKNALALHAAREEAAGLRSRFEALLNQVHPHFLFNCLNILHSLIGADPQKAREFAARFARLYRTVLERGNEGLIPLQSEMNFVDDYLYLQKVRFDNTLLVDIALTTHVLRPEILLPPFAVQLSLENAIKHNIVSEDQPLHIRLYIDGAFLVVENTLQRRRQPVESTGLGLRNLRERYQMLVGQEPRVAEHDGVFRVYLPLVEAD